MGTHVEVLGQDASAMASSWLLIGHDVLHLVVIVHLLHEEVLANHLFVILLLRRLRPSLHPGLILSSYSLPLVSALLQPLNHLVRHACALPVLTHLC